MPKYTVTTYLDKRPMSYNNGFYGVKVYKHLDNGQKVFCFADSNYLYETDAMGAGVGYANKTKEPGDLIEAASFGPSYRLDDDMAA